MVTGIKKFRAGCAQQCQALSRVTCVSESLALAPQAYLMLSEAARVRRARRRWAGYWHVSFIRGGLNAATHRRQDFAAAKTCCSWRHLKHAQQGKGRKR